MLLILLKNKKKRLSRADLIPINYTAADLHVTTERYDYKGALSRYYSSKVMSISKVKSYSMVGITADKNFKNKKRY